MSVAEVAAEFGCTARTVRNVAHGAGVPLPRVRQGTVREACLGDVRWLAERLAAGASMTDIAEELGADIERVRAALDAVGLRYVAPRQRHLAPLYEPGWLSARFAAGATLASIAAEVGCSRSAVQRAARRLPKPPRPARYPQLTDRSWLHRRYVAQGRSMATIADELGANVNTVAAALRRAGIKSRPAGGARPGDRPPRPPRHPQLYEPGWLRDRLEAGATLQAVADEVGSCTATVRRAVRKMLDDRPDRASSGSNRTRRAGRYPQLDQRRWLRSRYVTAGLSTTAIGAEVGTTGRTVARALHRAGIKTRPANGSRIHPRPPRYPQLYEPGWLRGRLHAGATLTAIAADVGCQRATVRRARDVLFGALARVAGCPPNTLNPDGN